ncbi:MAG: DNA-3-methyladenine glycosylase [Bacteroidales bacterium]|nr:DNA-3-methyladenine glycosylase [Bacteroidales bacterium]
MKLPLSYYLSSDVVALARDLLGKYLFTQIDGQLAGGIITETEAYKGIGDRACHSFGGLRTARNEIMYHTGGVAYVYFCYGMHNMFNVVTNVENEPEAVLIRAIFPTHGEELMLQRLRKSKISATLTNGPGKLTKALGITRALNGKSLRSEEVWLEDRGLYLPDEQVQVTPRIGVDYAGGDALLPYRFVTTYCPTGQE